MTETTRIVVAHDELTAKLTELRRREAHVRAQLSPLRHLANPWLYVAIAGVVGYRLGRPGVREAPAPARDETLSHAVIRASVVVVAQAVVRHAVTALVELTRQNASRGVLVEEIGSAATATDGT